jgi:hypothetical protein
MLSVHYSGFKRCGSASVPWIPACAGTTLAGVGDYSGSGAAVDGGTSVRAVFITIAKNV